MVTSSNELTHSRMTVLILGATGIIGRELVTAAIRRGFDVVGISRHPPVSLDPRVTYLAIDGYDTGIVSSALEGRHFLAVLDLLSFRADALDRSLRTLAAQCDQYVFFSSATIYSDAGRENLITEQWPRVTAGWSYPLRKIGCERRLRTVCAELGTNFTIVRPYITYSDQRIPFGPWEADEVLARFALQRPIVLGNEIAKARTSLTDSRDLARATLQLVANPAAYNEDFHIASPESWTWAQVYDIAGEIMGIEPWIVPAPAEAIRGLFPHLAGKISDRRLHRIFDNSKLHEACPDFSFTHTLTDGFSRALSSYQTNKAAAQDPVLSSRFDRLAISSASNHHRSVKRDRREYAAGLVRSSPKSYLRYELEYRPILRPVLGGLRFLKAGLKRKGHHTPENLSPYG